MTVGNPKEVIQKSWANITALQASILTTGLTLAVGTYGINNPESWYSDLDIIQAYSMPVLQLRSAVESMNTIKDIGEHAFEDKRRTLILELLFIIFMVVPFVGEGLGAIAGGAAVISRIFTLVAEGGNFAKTVGEIVANPKSAPFAILGLLVGSAGLTGGEAKLSKLEGIEAASSARGLIKDSEIGKFPQNFKDRDALIQKSPRDVNRQGPF
ncbi:hypothetical protein NLG97_g6283 [Lecanicillium saksenae]|uniref:Uncharacterized protein n=1 Tax=Lecanicillium saksenae TaxID=468837 RepID=A0ACC1QRR3_9HYPO|nr:hypothetical protein NLG97_g6283 [Lecanicillium saksenae]